MSGFGPQEGWRIERLLGREITEDGDIQYLVKWVNGPDVNYSWEPYRNCIGSLKQIKIYEHNLRCERGNGSKFGSLAGFFESDMEWPISKIVDKKIKKGQVYYKVRWSDTWEPYRNVIGALEFIDEFEEELSSKQNTQKSGCNQRNENIEPKKSAFINSAELDESKDTQPENNGIDIGIEKKLDNMVITERGPTLRKIRNEEPIIEFFMAKKIENNQAYYLVKWLNDHPKETSWEPFCNCLDAIELLLEFEEELEDSRVSFQNNHVHIPSTYFRSEETLQHPQTSG